MSDSEPTNDVDVPDTPGLADANRKLRSATERLRQLNQEVESTPIAGARGPEPSAEL
jgi:hypothetical protein